MRSAFEAFGGAAAIALLGSAMFALSARAWLLLCSRQARRSPFHEALLPEPAQRFREELDFLGGKQSALLASGLVFALLFAFAWLSGAAKLFAGAQTWLLVVVASILAAASGYALRRLVLVFTQRRRLAFRRFANVATGQVLQRVGGNLNRVFHDVPCDGGIIDHVLVGEKGIYAVYVVTRRPGRHKRVRTRDGRLWFSPGGESLALDGYAATSDRLARQLRKVIGGQLRVRSVLVVPGWEIEEQSGDEFLVVNERSLIMLRGWRDRGEYLMNEDVESLHDHLTQRSAAVEAHEVREWEKSH